MQRRVYRTGVVAAAAMTAAWTTAAIVPSTVTAADPCVSGAEVRAQVHELVASLRDDIGARSTRAHIAAALVDTLHTFRGAKADSAAERQALGQAIAALAKQLQSAESLVARKAIVTEILALTEQRERGPFTADERAELEAAVAALKNAVVARTDRAVEGREVAAAFSALHEQFTCRPA
jgi:leucyl-tRNA synthetase